MKVGSWELGVRADSPRTAAAVRHAFNAYISLSGTPVRSNFSLRGPTGLLGRSPGELFIAGVAVARSRSFDHLLDALAGHLAALAINTRPVEVPRVRAFTSGTRVVLTDLLRPALVDDHTLAKHGVHELHLWNPEFVEGPAVVLPPPLKFLVGLQTSPMPPTLKVTGALLCAESAELDDHHGWLHALRRHGMELNPVSFSDVAAMRDAIIALA